MTTVDTSKEGLYLVWRCGNEECRAKGGEKYAFVGVEGAFDVVEEGRRVGCSWCKRDIGETVRILLRKCRWSYRGMLTSEEERISGESATPSDIELDEIHQFDWKWLKISVRPLHSLPPIKRRRSSDSPDPPTFQTTAAANLNLEEIREDVRRKQEIIDILKSEMKAKEREKRELEEKVHRMREEVEKLKQGT